MLALELEALQPPPVLAARLDAIARGIDPDAVLDEKTGQRSQVPIPWELRLRAQMAILDRQIGKPKSHVVLEGSPDNPISVQARADIRVATFALDARDVDKGLPAAALDEFRAMQRKLVEAAKAKVKALTERAVELAEGDD